jgi:hypothetical protein
MLATIERIKGFLMITRERIPDENETRNSRLTYRYMAPIIRKVYLITFYSLLFPCYEVTQNMLIFYTR